MIRLGLDFDNTLVHYDNLFHKLAVERNLVPKSLKQSKQMVRDYLRKRGKDNEFTRMQGEVYGLRICEAKPAEGIIKSLAKARREGIELIIISHKTKRPYQGPNYDLHEAAWQWLTKNKFFDCNAIGMNPHNVFFEESKEKKIDRIARQKCTHYVDDLIEILLKIKGPIKKIHYSPEEQQYDYVGDILRMTSWSQLNKLIQ